MSLSDALCYSGRKQGVAERSGHWQRQRWKQESEQTERLMDEKGEKRWWRGEKVCMTIRDACRVTGCELTLKVHIWIWTQKQKKGMHHRGVCLTADVLPLPWSSSPASMGSRDTPLLPPAGSYLSACNTKQQQKQTQLQPHILASDAEGLMKYPVPINLSPGGRRRPGTLIKCSY